MKRSKKRARNLRSRQIDWEQLIKSEGDPVRKYPRGFKNQGVIQNETKIP